MKKRFICTLIFACMSFPPFWSFAALEESVTGSHSRTNPVFSLAEQPAKDEYLSDVGNLFIDKLGLSLTYNRSTGAENAQVQGFIDLLVKAPKELPFSYISLSYGSISAEYDAEQMDVSTDFSQYGVGFGNFAKDGEQPLKLGYEFKLLLPKENFGLIDNIQGYMSLKFSF